MVIAYIEICTFYLYFLSVFTAITVTHFKGDMRVDKRRRRKKKNHATFFSFEYDPFKHWLFWKLESFPGILGKRFITLFSPSKY